MGIKAQLQTAVRSLTRRKSKNLSAILAITLGVTLLVGVQITTETLKESFLTSLLTSEGEVDIRVSNTTTTGYLSESLKTNLTTLVPEAVGLLPELTTTVPLLQGAQFEPYSELAGVPLDYPEVFGEFYDWKTGEAMEISDYLTDNTSTLMSSELAINLDLTQETELPIEVTTEFTQIDLVMTMVNGSPLLVNGSPVFEVEYSIKQVNLTVKGFFDANRPGIGAMTGSSIGRLVMSLDSLQSYVALQDPTRNTNKVGAWAIALKGNHFNSEIDEDYLTGQVAALKEKAPKAVDPETGEMTPLLNIYSNRLVFFEIADLFFGILNTFLTTLGILIVATGLLLITNVQLMSVEDREFQTGVMRAVGLNRLGVFNAYLFETVFQGVVGGLVGLVGGILFGWLIAFYLGGLFGTGRFSVEPVVYPEFVVLAVVVGILLAVLTGILPSVRAAQVNIVEALRGIKSDFEEKSSRNFGIGGFLLMIVGILVLLQNGLFDDQLNYLWEFKAGYDTIAEWENILLGFGLFITGGGLLLSSFIDRVRALNIMAIFLWAVPIFAYIEGLNWIESGGSSMGSTTNFLLYSVLEIIVGSVLLVGLNLERLMDVLRGFLLRLRGLTGVGQIAPSLISSHKTRSTLTFAIFAVILTLNVLIASIVATNQASTIGQAGEDARGVDFYVSLSRPEDTRYPFADEIYNIDDRVEDVIPLKTCDSCGAGQPNLISFKDPYSPDFDITEDVIPFRFVEFGSDQIRGQGVTDASDPNWRYDYYLRNFPDGLQDEYDLDMTDEDILDLSRQAWDQFFNSSYTMTAYNFSDFGGFGGFMQDNRKPELAITVNGTVVENPIVFSDSFILPVGTQIWVPMNASQLGLPVYQTFTVGGRLDSQRAGGFPLTPSFDEGASVVGSLFIPEYWSQYTNYFGEANGQTPFSRKPNQYNAYLVKTSLLIDDPAVGDIARKVEAFTNTNNDGYREKVGTNLITASAITLYSGIEESLEAATQITDFLQIYVGFGLVIGAVGMGVISVRNVAERRREIGMMRAIGFPRFQVMLSVLMELLVLGIIGLTIGVVNGLIITYGLTTLSNGAVVVPWDRIALYLGFIAVVASIAGALPGYSAARIPPSEALRYVG